MRKAFCSPATKIAALLIGYVAAVSAVRAMSPHFSYYVSKVIGDWLNMGMSFSLALFAFCSALLIVSVWKTRDSPPRFWHKIDVTILGLLTYCVAFLCAYYAWHGGTPVQLLPLSVAVYLTVMGLLAEITARIRDNRLKSTLYWMQFFKLYTLRQPIGLLTAALLIGNLFYLFVQIPVDAIGLPTPSALYEYSDQFVLLSRSSYYLNTPLFLFSAFTLAALTYFCVFLLSLSTEYEKANEEKIRAERFKAELITNVSHDIRTPLTSIINYVDLLKSLDIGRADFADYVSVLDRKSARLKTLVGDLMEASKAGTGNVSMCLREIDLSEIVGQIAGEFEDQFAERGLTFVYRQPDDPVPVKADNAHLWRVLENLFGNAVKYALPGTRVFAEISLRAGNPVFSLKNTSQSPIEVSGDLLTEQFIRGDRARQTEGSGLGLYIAKSLVELMGGRFNVRVTGDLFEVELLFG